MSTTEDCELQDLVKQALERTGSLSKIRAELRAGIFLALEENGSFQGTHAKNPELQNLSEDTDGALVLCLIKEFLDCFGLTFTMSVLDPELASFNVHCSWKNRNELIEHLNLAPDLNNEKKKPLIYYILQQFRDRQGEEPSLTSRTPKKQQESSSSPDNQSSVPLLTFSPKATEPTHARSDEMIMKQEGTIPSKSSSKSDCVEWKTNMKAPAVGGKDSFVTDLCKSNLSLLGDLPPLSPSANTGKTSLSPSNKSSLQMSKLKAMLIDSSQETTNASNVTDDELTNSIDQDEISDLDNLDEKQIQELLKE